VGRGVAVGVEVGVDVGVTVGVGVGVGVSVTAGVPFDDHDAPTGTVMTLLGHSPALSSAVAKRRAVSYGADNRDGSTDTEMLSGTTLSKRSVTVSHIAGESVTV